MSRPVPPPMSIAWQVELWAPGVYREFWEALVGGVTVPVIPTSYWRSPSENRRVGGDQDSQHLIGLGLDLVFQSEADKQQAASALRARGLVAVIEPAHLHVQAWPAGVARTSGLLSHLGL